MTPTAAFATEAASRLYDSPCLPEGLELSTITPQDISDGKEDAQSDRGFDSGVFLANPVLSTDEASVANVFTAEQDMRIEAVTAFADIAETNLDAAIYLLGDEAQTPTKVHW